MYHTSCIMPLSNAAMLQERQLRAILRQLRSRLGLTQTQMAEQTGRTLGTIQRYETQIPPSGAALAAFVNLASDAGFHDIAGPLRAAIVEDLGPELVRAIAGIPRSQRHVPRDLQHLVDQFVEFMSSAEGLPQEKLIREMLPEILMSFRKGKSVRYSRIINR